MITNIPDTEYLLQGINDQDLPLDGKNLTVQVKEEAKATETSAGQPADGNNADALKTGGKETGKQETKDPQETIKPQETNESVQISSSQPSEADDSAISPNSGREQCWLGFLGNLKAMETSTDKSERLVIKLDRDLIDSLDDLDFNGCYRTELANAIVRSFLVTYLPRLMPYRRTKKSMFANYNPEKHEARLD